MKDQDNFFKSIFIKQFILLILLAISSCGDKSNILGFDTRMMVINETGKKVYYTFSTKILSDATTSYSTRVALNINEKNINSIPCCWEDLLKEYNDLYYINVIDATIYESNDWSTIQKNNMVDTSIALNQRYLDSVNYKITLK
jgi:hypothetical protein